MAIAGTSFVSQLPSFLHRAHYSCTPLFSPPFIPTHCTPPHPTTGGPDTIIANRNQVGNPFLFKFYSHDNEGLGTNNDHHEASMATQGNHLVAGQTQVC